MTSVLLVFNEDAYPAPKNVSEVAKAAGRLSTFEAKTDASDLSATKIRPEEAVFVA